MTLRHACALSVLLTATAGCSDRSDAERRLVATDAEGRTVVLHGINAAVTGAAGDLTATVVVAYPDGTPAAGLRYRLELPLGESTIVASEGVLSENGAVVVENLAGGFPPVVYNLYVDNELIGPVGVRSDAENRFEYLLRAKAGMHAADLAIVDLSTAERFELSDLRGRIVLMEFYTTHCAPCQPVLDDLDKLLRRRGEEWKGNVEILAVALDAIWEADAQVDSVTKHLHKNGWKSLRAVVPDQEFSWEPQDRYPFGVRGVPHSFLIDRDGTILWSGFPKCDEIEKRIDDLLRK